MGLAPYGEPTYVDIIKKSYRYKRRWYFFPKYELF